MMRGYNGHTHVLLFYIITLPVPLSLIPPPSSCPPSTSPFIPSSPSSSSSLLSVLPSSPSLASSSSSLPASQEDVPYSFSISSRVSSAYASPSSLLLSMPPRSFIQISPSPTRRSWPPPRSSLPHRSSSIRSCSSGCSHSTLFN